MKVSEFVGKTIKEIVIEAKADDGTAGYLIILDDNSKIMAYTDLDVFYDPSGDKVMIDVEPVKFREFFTKLD